MTSTMQKKICLLGDFAVGKTSLVRRFVEGTYDEKYLSTIGVTVSQKSLDRGDHQLKLLIWDLAGGESFSQYQQNYLRGSSGALVVMDLTRAESLDSIGEYAAQLLAVNPAAQLVFIGNKSDLAEGISVTRQQIESATAAFEMPVFLTSAKTGERVEAAFESIADLIEASP
jgi:small GTP-binding protein